MPRRTASGTRVAGILTAGVLALGLASSTPCHACSCAESPTVAGSAEGADVVFVGTFVDTRESPVRVPGLLSSGGTVARVFEVSEVRKGQASARTEIATEPTGGSCGLEVEEGRTYVVVARASVEGLRGDLCGGTRLLSATTTADLDSVGVPVAPAPGTRSAELPVVDGALRAVAGAPIVWGPVAAILTAVVTAAVLLLRRRRA